MSGRIAVIVAATVMCMYVSCSKKASTASRKPVSLIGLSRTQVLADLGQPAATTQFAIDDGLGESQVELYNHYPPGKSKGVQIIEDTWKTGDELLTIWFHKPNTEWISLDACLRTIALTY